MKKHPDALMMDTPEESLDVVLTPFNHQVAGHNPIFTIGESIICKPRDPLEGQFYFDPPGELVGYIPDYKGKTEVSCRYEENDSPVLSAQVPRSLVEEKENISQHEHFTSGKNRNENNISKDSECLKFIKRLIKSKGFWTTSTTEEFILIENVISGFRHPCILDIKLGTSNLMGTEDDDKRKLLLNRMQTTISISHGIRLHGMRVFRYPHCQFEIQKKLWGREFSKSEETFKQALQNYLDNGLRFRDDVCKALCRKLKTLHAKLQMQKKYNLFACSLLVLYEGDDASITSRPDFSTNIESREEEPRVAIKLIDFAKTTTSELFQNGDTGGITFGIMNLVRILDSMDS